MFVLLFACYCLLERNQKQKKIKQEGIDDDELLQTTDQGSTHLLYTYICKIKA